MDTRRAAPGTYDAIVVGAGPAGSVTALGLARAGYSVLLVDRRAFPRAKPCGDCLSPEAARVLDRLGLLGAVDRLAPARLDGWRIWSPDGTAFHGAFAAAARGDPRVTTALAIPRDRLDQALLCAALDAGVELRAPLHVERLIGERDGCHGLVARDAARVHTLRARLVVGADGLRSVVARRAGATRRPGRLRKLSLSLHPLLPGRFTSGFGEMHVIEGGCIGLAPVEAGDPARHNLTFVTDARRRGREAGRDAGALMRSMVHAAPGLARRRAELLGAMEHCGPALASGPFDRPVRFVAADGIALVGDAAGYYDPFTGQGVYQALAGAERLAQVAGAALRDGEGVARAARLRPYARWVAASRRPARTVQRGVEFVAARPALMNRFARALREAPSFADALIAATGDLAPARSLAGAPLVALGAALLRQGSTR